LRTETEIPDTDILRQAAEVPATLKKLPGRAKGPERSSGEAEP